MDTQITPSSPSVTSVAPTPIVTQTPLKWPWILGGVALLIIGGIGGIFLGKQMANTTTASVATVPTIATDPTADWKTYTSKDFSLKYPLDLDVLSENNSKIEFGNSIFKTIILSIYFSDLTTLPTNSVDALLDGKQAKKFLVEGATVSGEYFAIQTTERPLIEVRYASGLGNSREVDQRIFDQILSTFKFTN